MADDEDVIIEEDAADTQAESFIWKYFADIIHHEKKGGSKNLQCKFCDRTFTGMSTTRAVAHIFGRSVMGQATPGIKGCIAIKTEEDDRRADLKKARDELGAVIREKESGMNSRKRKQGVLDALLSPKSK